MTQARQLDAGTQGPLGSVVIHGDTTVFEE